MARSNVTDISFVLDRSGSMMSIQGATLEAFNAFLHSQRSGEGTARMTLVQFDDQYEVAYRNIPLAEAVELDATTFVPRGSTALLDAIGRTILDTERRLGEMPETSQSSAVLFVVQTDGYENASRMFTLDQINAMIAERRDRRGWQFVFLGANQDAIATAVSLGMGAAQALTYRATAGGAQHAISALDRKVHQMRRSRSQGMVDAQVEFDSEDHRKALEDSAENPKDS